MKLKSCTLLVFLLMICGCMAANYDAPRPSEWQEHVDLTGSYSDDGEIDPVSYHSGFRSMNLAGFLFPGTEFIPDRIQIKEQGNMIVSTAWKGSTPLAKITHPLTDKSLVITDSGKHYDAKYTFTRSGSFLVVEENISSSGFYLGYWSSKDHKWCRFPSVGKR